MGLLQVIQQSSSRMLIVGYLIHYHLSLLLLSVYVKSGSPSLAVRHAEKSRPKDGAACAGSCILPAAVLAVILAAVAAAVLIVVLAAVAAAVLIVVLAVVLIVVLAVVSAVSGIFHIVIIISCHRIYLLKMNFCYRLSMAFSLRFILVIAFF